MKKTLKRSRKKSTGLTKILLKKWLIDLTLQVRSVSDRPTDCVPGISKMFPEKTVLGGVLAAHKNPRFVEDCVRQMAKKVLAEFEYLSGDSVVTIKQTNEESIHQHDAYAERTATIAELVDEMNGENRNADE
jgi:GTP cyclohydrolase FolE2